MDKSNALNIFKQKKYLIINKTKMWMSHNQKKKKPIKVDKSKRTVQLQINRNIIYLLLFCFLCKKNRFRTCSIWRVSIPNRFSIFIFLFIIRNSNSNNINIYSAKHLLTLSVAKWCNDFSLVITMKTINVE